MPLRPEGPVGAAILVDPVGPEVDVVEAVVDDPQAPRTTAAIDTSPIITLSWRRTGRSIVDLVSVIRIPYSPFPPLSN